MNAAQIEAKLDEKNYQIQVLWDEVRELEAKLGKQREIEAKLAELAAWTSVRELHCELGSFFACATEWDSSAGGRVLRCRVGAGLRRKDGKGIDLLAVYELTDYRGRTIALVNGQRPPVEIEMEIMRHFDAKRGT